MALDFPASPTDGQLYAGANGVLYQWSASRGLWLSTPSVQVPPGGDVSAWATNAGSSTSFVTILFNNIVSGNSGGWYNPANGRYTPPAGRYFIHAMLWAYSSAGSTQFNLGVRKNGTFVTSSIPLQGTPSANMYGSVTYNCIVDANGSDWFDVQQSGGVAASGSQAIFSAFPLGVVVAMNEGYRLLGRQTLAAPAASFDFRNLPSDINDLEIGFNIAAASNAQDLLLRFYDNTNTLLSANYISTVTAATHAQAANSAATVMGSAVVTGGPIVSAGLLTYSGTSLRASNTSSIVGNIWVPGIRSSFHKYWNFQASYLSDNGSWLITVTGGGRLLSTTNLTGVQLAFSSGVNSIAGSTAAVRGSP